MSPTEETVRRRARLGPAAVARAHEIAAAAPTPGPDVLAALEVILASARHEVRHRRAQAAHPNQVA